jgi:MarR family transcriptional regulator, organic hydroperoxide resistance regulator
VIPRASGKGGSSLSREQALKNGLTPRSESFAWRLRELSKGFAQALDRILAAEKMTYGEWRCLRVLWQTDGISQRELADKLDLTSAAIVFSVNRLERDGLAARVADPDDGRSVFIRLTRKAKRLNDVLKPKSHSIHSGIFRDFADEEVLTLERLLTKLQVGLDRQIAENTRAE